MQPQEKPKVMLTRDMEDEGGKKEQIEYLEIKNCLRFFNNILNGSNSTLDTEELSVNIET